jgi:DMSO/TMAO reductase YedYZ molybdopterin-dependent catalytic subunit
MTFHLASGPLHTSGLDSGGSPSQDLHVDRRTRRLLGPIAGVAAAAAGLGVAELVAAARRDFQSPVLDVGDRVVDSVPRPMKELAIEWFGTNDKKALLIGIASILLGYAVVVGVLSLRRRFWPAIAGISVFGLVGAYASQTTRRAAPIAAVVPSLVGAIAAAGVLWGLRRTLQPRTLQPRTLQPRTLQSPMAPVETPTGQDTASVVTEPRSTVADADRGGRRRFISLSAAAAIGAIAIGTTGRRLRNRFSVGSSRQQLVLPQASRPLGIAPTTIAPDTQGVSPFFTPNADFYRIDTALSVPQVPLDSWRLKLHGLVDRPVELTFDDLLQRQLVEADITLTCVSNEVGGKLIGTARWMGVRLDELLAEAGIGSDADQIIGRSVDGYTCGFPVSALDGRDALVAIAMNGEPLPLEHGFPARLIVPGLYGYVSATKWLSEIELSRFDQFDQYWVERGWDNIAPIKIQSRIDTPRGLSSVDPGTIAIGGVAWAQTRGIERVELQIDDGDWFEAKLADELNDVTWRQWSCAWEATSGRHSIKVRATEKNGPIQTDERSEPFPSGATGQHQIVVLVR